MAAKYWIKLYHEILDDPKMGMLPDNVYRRCIELFLLAGRLDDGGNLPGTTELAWMLRQNPETFEAELQHLEQVQIITKTDGGWIVTKFADRQAAVSDAERMRRYRERQQVDQFKNEPVTDELRDGNEPVTQPVTKRNADTDTDTDTDNTIVSPRQPTRRKRSPQKAALAASDKSLPQPKKMLMGEFQLISGMKMPGKNGVGFWWSSISEILDIANGDVDRAKQLIRDAYQKLTSDNLTVSGPNSLVKTCRSLSAKPANTSGHNLTPQQQRAAEQLRKLYATQSLESADV